MKTKRAGMQEIYKIGMDLGGTRVKLGLVINGRLEASDVFRIDSNKKLKPLLPVLEKKIIRLSEAASGAIQGIGLAFPGIVDPVKNKIVDTSAKYTDAPTLDLSAWTEQSFGLPLRMDGDARMACLGEWRYGSGMGATDMVMMTLGTGIGTAAVIDGRLLRGKHFQAGMLGGHMVIDYKNKATRCGRGNYGCVEAVASMWMIEKTIKEHPLFRESLLYQVDHINWEAILRSSEQGDELSEMLKQQCLEAWGAGLVNLIHAYDPEKVVIGGGISRSGNILLPAFTRILNDQAWCPGGIPVLRAAEFPESAAVLGAAALFDE